MNSALLVSLQAGRANVFVMDDLVTYGCGISALSGLPAGSVDLLLSDPPSGETRAEFDAKPDLEQMWRSIWHAAKPAGIVVLFASSLEFACEVKNGAPRCFRYDLIWRKSVATGHLNSRKRPLRSHGFALVFFRKPGTYHPQMACGAAPIHAAKRFSHGENYGPISRQTKSRAGATDRYPTSVLEFASVGTSSRTRTHPQQKPVPLMRWFVRAYSNPGDLVADPFAGSGSSGKAALLEGRRFVGWDSSPRFGR